MSELLESRWNDTKAALLEGLGGTKKAVMATTLENTPAKRKATLTEGTEVTGNREEKMTQNKADDTDNNVVDIKRLAGLN
jgi:hypothetical protein